LIQLRFECERGETKNKNALPGGNRNEKEDGAIPAEAAPGVETTSLSSSQLNSQLRSKNGK
jgi:hypothetical protein